MYTNINFKTKKALKDAIASGREISVYQPNNIFNQPTPTEGQVSIEGPHYPEPHCWYATAILKNGLVTSVK